MVLVLDCSNDDWIAVVWRLELPRVAGALDFCGISRPAGRAVCSWLTGERQSVATDENLLSAFTYMEVQSWSNSLALSRSGWP